MTPRDVQQYCTPRLAYNRAVRQQSVPIPTTGMTSVQVGTDPNLVQVGGEGNRSNLVARQSSQPVPRAVSPTGNYRDISVIYESPVGTNPGNGIRHESAFNSEMELLQPALVTSCTSEELNIAIQGVMQTIEEERAVRANEVADLRRELYQMMHQERETHAREFNDLKSEITTQNESFMKEIIRRSEYEARLQNDVEQICKDPEEAKQELHDRFASIERELETMRKELGEGLLTAADSVLAVEQVIQQAAVKPQLGPEVLSDPRLVELLVASTDSSIQMIQQQIHELVGQKIEAHLGGVNDATSLFGMVREALTNSRQNSEEIAQVKDILSLRTIGTESESNLLDQAQSPQPDPYGDTQTPLHKVKRREGNYS